MARAYTSASASYDDERYDLRLQKRNRKRLSFVAGSCAFVSLVFISWIFHNSWNIAFSDDGPSNAEEAALAKASVIAMAKEHSLMAGRTVNDPAPKLETHSEIQAVLGGGDGDGIGKTTSDEAVNKYVDAKNGNYLSSSDSFGLKREVHVRVHVVVESSEFKTTELLLVRDFETKQWGPVLSSAKVSLPRDAGYKQVTSDTGVVDAAAAVLFNRLGLGQPPDIEFMQGIPASGDDGDGDGDDGDAGNDASFVVVVRDENVIDDEHGVLTIHGKTGMSEMKDKKSKSKAKMADQQRTETSDEFAVRTADERDFSLRETRRVPLRAALSGSANVDNKHALQYDVHSLRVFLEPWVLTDGKDPKAACRDPKVLAARAAGDEEEANMLYDQLPKHSRDRPLTMLEQIHGR